MAKFLWLVSNNFNCKHFLKAVNLNQHFSTILLQKSMFTSIMQLFSNGFSPPEFVLKICLYFSYHPSIYYVLSTMRLEWYVTETQWYKNLNNNLEFYLLQVILRKNGNRAYVNNKFAIHYIIPIITIIWIIRIQMNSLMIFITMKMLLGMV